MCHIIQFIMNIYLYPLSLMSILISQVQPACNSFANYEG